MINFVLLINVLLITNCVGTFYLKLINDAMNRTKKTSGYICPYVKNDCVHIDSLSMTKTVICNQCKSFMAGTKANNGLTISFTDGRNALRILTN